MRLEMLEKTEDRALDVNLELILFIQQQFGLSNFSLPLKQYQTLCFSRTYNCSGLSKCHTGTSMSQLVWGPGFSMLYLALLWWDPSGMTLPHRVHQSGVTLRELRLLRVLLCSYQYGIPAAAYLRDLQRYCFSYVFTPKSLTWLPCIQHTSSQFFSRLL